MSDACLFIGEELEEEARTALEGAAEILDQARGSVLVACPNPPRRA